MNQYTKLLIAAFAALAIYIAIFATINAVGGSRSNPPDRCTTV